MKKSHTFNVRTVIIITYYIIELCVFVAELVNSGFSGPTFTQSTQSTRVRADR